MKNFKSCNMKGMCKMNNENKNAVSFFRGDPIAPYRRYLSVADKLVESFPILNTDNNDIYEIPASTSDSGAILIRINELPKNKKEPGFSFSYVITDRKYVNLVSQYKWSNSNGYAKYTYKINGSSKNIYLHRLILFGPRVCFKTWVLCEKRR